MALTRRQRQVYDFIAQFVQSRGYSPSFEEIGEGLGLSSLATVHKHISNLEKKGLLKRDYNRSRSIDVLPPRGRMKQAMAIAPSWPLVGRIAAGRPVEAIQNPPATFAADFPAAIAAVLKVAAPGDLVLTLGAGNVSQLGPQILAALESKG